MTSYCGRHHLRHFYLILYIIRLPSFCDWWRIKLLLLKLVCTLDSPFYTVVDQRCRIWIFSLSDFREKFTKYTLVTGVQFWYTYLLVSNILLFFYFLLFSPGTAVFMKCVWQFFSITILKIKLPFFKCVLKIWPLEQLFALTVLYVESLIFKINLIHVFFCRKLRHILVQHCCKRND